MHEYPKRLVNRLEGATDPERVPSVGISDEHFKLLELLVYDSWRFEVRPDYICIAVGIQYCGLSLKFFKKLTFLRRGRVNLHQKQ